MDELREILVNLKLDSKILAKLVEAILDSCLRNSEDKLFIEVDTKIMSIIETFYPDKYAKRLKELKEADNGL